MPLGQLAKDNFEWAENAGIEVDVNTVRQIRSSYKQTPEGLVAIFTIELKPGVVTFPEDLLEFESLLTATA